MELLWYFLAGAFAFNAVPHMVKGITGQTHMTPFKRVSSPALNIIWAFINVIVALYLLGLGSGLGGLVVPWEAALSDTNLVAYLLGGFVVATFLASFWSDKAARLPWHKD